MPAIYGVALYVRLVINLLPCVDLEELSGCSAPRFCQAMADDVTHVGGQEEANQLASRAWYQEGESDAVRLM